MSAGGTAGTVVGVIFGLVGLYIAYILYKKYSSQSNYGRLDHSHPTSNSYANKIQIKKTSQKENGKNRSIDLIDEVKNPLYDKTRTNVMDVESSRQRSEEGDSKSNSGNENNNNNINNNSNNHQLHLTKSIEINTSDKQSNHEDDIDEEKQYERVETLGITKSGYLYKKSTSLKKDWLRRWFFIKDGKLFYCHVDTDIKNSRDIQAVQVANLVISTVKEVNHREFQIISPGVRSSQKGGGKYELQAETDDDAKDWVRVIRLQIEGSLTQTLVADTVESIKQNDSIFFVPNEKILQELHETNPMCADCNSETNVTWASLNLCIMICIECSGIHRSLGTHISKVRSITLDKWSPHNIQLILTIGNKKSNMIWEDGLPDISMKITPSASRDERESYITEKYVNKRYVAPTLFTIDANNLALRAAATGKVYNLMQAIAAGADLNVTWVSGEIDTGKTPLHMACENNFILCVELLCINNANVHVRDFNNQLPIDIAKSRGKNEIVDILTYYTK